MDRLERMLSLVHVLQSSRRPVSMAELRERFPAYGEGSHEASRRKIERDKAELAKIGLVIRYLEDGDDSGYALDREASYLPEFNLSSDQRRLLAGAARAALQNPDFPHRRALRLALAKLEAEPSEPNNLFFAYDSYSRDPTDGRVEELSRAIANRKEVDLDYRKASGDRSTRRLQPFGLFVRRGTWYVVGRDHRSEETRVFRISRIDRLETNSRKPSQADYSIPAEFKLAPHTEMDPLHFEVNDTVLAEVRLHPDLTFLGERLWGQAAEPDGVFRIETTHLDYLIDQVLGFGTRAELLSPPEGRAAIAEILSGILDQHGAGE